MLRTLLVRLLDARKGRKFDKVFAGGADPYRYGRLEFERRRIVLMARCLGGRRYLKALEVGCAVGHVTRMLSGLCEHGLRLLREEAVEPTGEPGTDQCLVSLLEKPSGQ